MNDVCRFSRDHVVECSERTVLSCLELVCLFVYVGDVPRDTSPIKWQRVMVGQQILCTSIGTAWKHCLLVIGCLFLHSNWMMCLLPILL